MPHDPSAVDPLSAKVQSILNETKALLPPMFLVNTDDIRLMAYLELTLNEINLYPPETSFTLESVPNNWMHLVPFGANVYAALFLQANLSLQEFDFNDNGLSVRTNFVAQLDTSYKNLLSIWERRMLQAKNNILIQATPKGIGSPRYANSIGQFLKISYGSGLNSTGFMGTSF